MPPEEAAQLTGPTLSMLQRARSTVNRDADDQLQMLCVRTKKYEMLLCSEADGKYAICVLQDPQPEQNESSLVFQAKEARSVLRGSMARAAPGLVF